MPEALLWYRSHVSLGSHRVVCVKCKPVASPLGVFYKPPFVQAATLCTLFCTCNRQASFHCGITSTQTLLLLQHFSHILEKKPNAQKGKVSVHLASFSLFAYFSLCVLVAHKTEGCISFCSEARFTPTHKLNPTKFTFTLL